MTDHPSYPRTRSSEVGVAVAGHPTVAYFDCWSEASKYSNRMFALGYSPVSVSL